MLLLTGICLKAEVSNSIPDTEGELFLGYGVGYNGTLAFCSGIVKTSDWGRLTFRSTALGPYSEAKKMSSGDLMLGKTVKLNNILASLSVGIGMIEGASFGIGVPGWTFGYPLEVQFSQMPIPFHRFNYAFGINIFGNINKYSPMIGIALVGKFVK